MGHNRCILLAFLAVGILTGASHLVHAESNLLWPKLVLPELQWTEEIKPGLSEHQVARKLRSMGIQFHNVGGSYIYTSRIITNERSYLFCNDRLFAIIERRTVEEHDFTKWFQTFLLAHRRYGPPEQYSASEELSSFRAMWHIENDNTLMYQLQAIEADKQTWFRELYANDYGASCFSNNR